MQDADPLLRPCCEAHCCHALLNPGPVQSVEGLLEVEEDKDTRLLGLLAVVYLLQVGQDVIPYPPLWQEASLRAVHNM